MAWSPYKQMVIDYVAAHPGCSKWDVAKRCTWNRLRCPSKQYYIVNTALRNGWIEGEFHHGRYYLNLPSPQQEIPEGATIRFTAEGGFHVV